MTANRNRSTDLDVEVANQVKSLIAITPGASVSKIADDLNMRRATLSVRVNGHVPFAPDLLSAVARRLDTKASDLVRAAENKIARASDKATTAA